VGVLLLSRDLGTRSALQGGKGEPSVKKHLMAGLAAALLALPASAMADPTPAAYYPFDDCSTATSASNAVSGSSGNPALTFHNGATMYQTTGAGGGSCLSGSPQNGALQVNPGMITYDDFAQANGSDDAAFRGVSELTLAADVAVNNADNFWQTVALQDRCGTIHSNTASCIGYALFAQNDANGGKVPRGYVRYTCPDTQTQLVEVSGDSQLGTDYHSLALTAGSGVGATVRLYVDGEFVESAAPTLSCADDEVASLDSGTSGGRFTVGGELITGTIDGLGYMNPNEVLHGLVDNLRFYNEELDAFEVANIAL